MRRFLHLEEGWLTFGLMTLMIMSVVWSVEAAAWVDDINLVPWVAFSGILIGVLFSKLKLPALILHPLALIAGSGIVVYAMARTLPDAPLLSRMGEVVDRLLQWLQVVIGSRGIGTDNMLFLMMLAALAWLIGYFSAWTVFRMHTVWWALLASGTAIVVNLSYAYTLIGHFFLFMITAMLLVVRFNIFNQERTWKTQHVNYDDGISWGFMRDSIITCVAVLFLAYIIPPTTISASVSEAWDEVTTPWQDVQSEFNRVFAGLRPLNDFTVSGFGKALALKGTVRLSNAIVMYVKSPEPRYIHAVALDQYTSNGFIWSDKTSTEITPGDLRLQDAQKYEDRVDFTQHVQILTPKGTWLFSGGAPISSTIPFNASGPLSDPSALNGLAAFKRGDSYTVTVSVSVAPIELLRQAGENYPTYIRRTYTQLPETLPQRVRDLARSITASSDNPYDKASAIEKYLRENYKYNTNVPPPPRDQDGVDYFLFDGKQGYCDYYATAMAVMLRTMGIPSRVVAGYMPGEVDPTTGDYVIRESNSHAWVEVYFPHYGWIEFEPTPSQPLRPRFTNAAAAGITSPFPDETDPASADTSDLDQDLLNKENARPLPPENVDETAAFVNDAVHKLFFVLLLLAVAVATFAYWWQRAYSGLSLPQAFYARMTRLASWFGMQPQRSETPYEYARSLSGMLPDGSRSINTITSAYVRSEFGHKLVDDSENNRLASEWNSIRNQILRTGPGRLAQKLGTIRIRFPKRQKK